MKPPMPYFGGKQRIADRIVEHFPPHLHYVEPYAGGLSVFFAKPRSQMETLNDIDGALVTFWRVLRDRPQDLLRACALTPHSREELANVQASVAVVDELETARRVWVLLSQGRGAKSSTTGWRFYLDASTASGSFATTYLNGYLSRVLPAAERLHGAQLESRDALDVIADYGSKPSTLLYVDPPYVRSARSNDRPQYRHEVDDVHHQDLVRALRECMATVVLSGYAHPLYDEALGDWQRVEVSATTQQANNGRNGRTEVLWINRTAHVLDFTDGASA